MAVGPENMWIKFFSDAGLPSGISATYALTFTENRIQMNMLLDLNKEYLREMGIVCMGDVIAILRHAKHVHDETARDRVLGITAPKVPVAAIAGRPGQPKPDSSTKRLLGHLTSNPAPSVRSESSNKNNANVKERLGDLRKIATKRKITTQDDDSRSKMNTEDESTGPINIKRRITLQPTSKNNIKEKVITEPIIERKLTDVFSRLGNSQDDDEKIKNKFANIKIPAKMNSEVQQNVFARLGGKEMNLIMPKKTFDCSDDSLKYEGVLKSTPKPKKLVINSNGNVRTLTKMPTRGTMQADKIQISIKEKLGKQLTHRKSVKFSPHVDCKLIESTASEPEVVLTQKRLPVTRNVTRVNFSNKNDVKLRLGNTKPTINGAGKVGVFGRLGFGNKHRVL